MGVSTIEKSYNPHAALARRGVYGVVVSGETTVTEYLVSSKAVERVAPAQPEPIITTVCFAAISMNANDSCLASDGMVDILRAQYIHDVVYVKCK